MTKTRTTIPAATKNEVLSAFNHRCAICGADKPHLHHIDEKPSNNDPLNLLPLCPNCHLTDQHDPTRAIETGQLKLFRQHRDPSILKPQFQPLYKRVQFLEEISDGAQSNDLSDNASELSRFVAALEMGEFYAKQIELLCKKPAYAYVISSDPARRAEYLEQIIRHTQEYQDQLRKAHSEVVSLVVEMLRFQKW